MVTEGSLEFNSVVAWSKAVADWPAFGDGGGAALEVVAGWLLAA